MRKLDAFGIFEGGGAKGIAHAGALKAAEEEEVNFLGVAGSSAGAIVAALVAAGYKADQIYSPEYTDSLFSGDLPSKLLDAKEWNSMKAIRDRFHRKRKIRKPNRIKTKAALVLASKWSALLLAVASGVAFWFLASTIAKIATGALFFLAILLLFTASRRFLSRIWRGTKTSALICCIYLIVPFVALWKLGILLGLKRNGGVLTKSVFKSWFNTQLLDKCRELNPAFEPSGEGEVVTFADLPMPLKIIAAESTTGKLHVFSIAAHAQLGVADAVCASMSIPFVFVPEKISGATFVDGGMMSNFPAWVFDEERRETDSALTLGFRLVAAQTADNQGEGKWSFWTHFFNVMSAAIFGDNTLERRNVAPLVEVNLPVDIGVIDFDAEPEKKRGVYNAARIAAKSELERPGMHWRVSDAAMRPNLETGLMALRRDIDFDGHLRMNVMLPIDSRHLRIAYSVNMDGPDDCDDRIILEKGQGAAGICWEQLESKICDMRDAADSYSTDWNMDKYQQRLVRTELKSLISLPLFNPSLLNDEGDNLAFAFIGVLNIDSDEDILGKFRDLMTNANGSDFATNLTSLVEQTLVKVKA